MESTIENSIWLFTKFASKFLQFFFSIWISFSLDKIFVLGGQEVYGCYLRGGGFWTCWGRFENHKENEVGNRNTAKT